ncbi:EAL domain-containing protein [Thauera mechernichensis]
MDVRTPPGFLAALSELSAWLLGHKSSDCGVGVIAFAVIPDPLILRLPLEHVRKFERALERRLLNSLRAQDLLFALDGSEWLILLPTLSSPAVLTLAMLKLDQAFGREPVQVDGLDLQVQVVSGAAMSPTHGQDAFHLLQSARIARVLAQRDGLANQVYDPAMDRVSPHAARLERDLREAFFGGSAPELHLQAKIHVASGECRSAEGLLRWRDSGGEAVPPPVVLGLIDRLGLRHTFNRWLFQHAARTLHGLRMAGLDIELSINLSATDLYDAEVPDLIEQALKTWNVAAAALCLEITETSMLEEAEGVGVTDVLKRLRELGVSLSIDDFGTGFSGMSRLKQLAVQEVKIDRSFVTDLVSSERDREIADSIIDLSHRLGLKVTAEGVERADTARVLAEMGCDFIQGFLYSRALPLDEFIAWVRARAGISV